MSFLTWQDEFIRRERTWEQRQQARWTLYDRIGTAVGFGLFALVIWLVWECTK